jgi:branched-subunit amino acid transport protein
LAEGWVLVLWLVTTTAVIRAAGPVALGGRDLPPRAMEVVALLAPALLAALVVTQTFGDDSELTLDARAIGIAGAGIVLAFKGGILLTIAVAMALTAAARAIG